MNAGAKSRASILRPRFSNDQLLPAPPESAWCRRSRSKPALAASTSDSLVASRLTATRIWLQSFAVWP
jgi:hypothetical protein